MESPPNVSPLFFGFLGSQRLGSDPRALAMAFRERGHTLIERCFDDYFPQLWTEPLLKMVRRLMKPAIVRDYNRAVLELLSIPHLDFLLVFKGLFLEPGTLEQFREAGIPRYLFYPDVSFSDHGPNIPRCLPFYDRIFTTKSFHAQADLPDEIRSRFELVRHGADPSHHRPRTLPPELEAAYSCDVSFVGCWSPKKEHLLRALVTHPDKFDVKIWGPGWERASPEFRAAWQGRPAWGDEVPVIYQLSKINLGLLSEVGGGVSSGDQTTARTWQIPHSGGFLLHEDTAEFRLFFEPNREAGVFSDGESLVAAVRRYLTHDGERQEIRKRGHQRCMQSGYTYRQAVQAIEGFHQKSR